MERIVRTMILTLIAALSALALLSAQDEGGQLPASDPGKQINVVPVDSIISKGGSYGIVIGVNNYQQGITPLKYAAADARSFFNVMTLPEFAGYNPNKFFLFSDDALKPELKPTRSNILQKLVTLQGLVTGGDTFYFYFSGHGIAAGGENYIILSDSILSLPQDSAISFSRLYELIAGIDCKKKVIILDACRNQIEPGKGENDRVFVQAKYAYAEGTVTLYSTAPGERSYEDEQAGHGVFTKCLLDGLRGKGDINGDKVISVSELFDYVFGGTLDWATQNNRIQKPWKDDRSSGDIPVAVVGGVGEVEYQSYTGGGLIGAAGAGAGGAGGGSLSTGGSAAFVDLGVIDGTMAALCGYVTWKIDPPNAVVKVDSLTDMFSGYCSAGLKSGVHRLTVSANGYDTQTLDFTTLVGQRQTLDVTLKRNSGYLTVKVNPPDSKITLPDGTEMMGGFSDLLLKNGEYTITVSHPDYWTEKVPVRIDIETPAVVEFDYTAWQLVPVSITVDPPNAMLTITSVDSKRDIRLEFSGSAEISLPAGDYEIEITADGYLTKAMNFSLAEDGFQQTIKLEKPWFNAKRVATLSGHSQDVYSVAFSPDGLYALTGSADSTAKLWSVPDGSEVATLSGHSSWVLSWVLSVAFSPDGRYALTGSGDETAKLWSVPDGTCVKTLTGHTYGVCSVAFSPDGRYALTGSADKTAKLWSVPDGSLIKSLTGHSNSVWSVAFSPDGRYALTGSADKTAKLWSVPDGALVKTLSGHSSCVTSVAFSPDGLYALTGSYDKTAKLWRVTDGSEVATLSGHSQDVYSVAFSPDGLYALTGSADSTAKLWSVPDGSEVATLSGHSKAVSSVAFSPDGQYIATGSVDNTAIIWEQSE